jgi:protein-tyrosine kinase
MSRIYDALENAGKERAPAGAAALNMPVKSAVPRWMEDRMMALCQRIESALQEKESGLVVEFAGAQAGNESTRILCTFVNVAASRLRRRILLLAASPVSEIHQVFSTGGLSSWEEVADGTIPVGEVLQEAHEFLTIGQLAGSDEALPSILSGSRFPAVLQELRDQFDLILIDAPPAGPSSDAEMLSSITDGVILVVEARKTRWQAIKSTMDRIKAQRGNVLGIILNRRRFYIPGFVYRLI